MPRMEDQQQEEEQHSLDHENDHEELHDDNPSVDTSRPFRSVKEAVAVFGERLLANGIHSPRPFTMPKQQETPQKPSSPVITPTMPPPSTNSKATNDLKQETPRERFASSSTTISISPSPSPSKATIYNKDNDHDHDKELAFANMLRRLEAELEDTKKELSELKERESETEIALASLNAELHKNMSKMAEAEAAAAAAKAVVLATKSSTNHLAASNNRDISYGAAHREEDSKRRVAMGSIGRMEHRSSLAQLLSLSKDIGAVRKQKKMAKKKKPIVPILGDIFSSKKKSSSTTLHNPLFAASKMYFS